MKKLLIPILFISGFFAIYEQSKAHPNVYVTVVAIVIFFFAMMKLSARTPSKHQENEDDNVQ
jgi:NADH:ubiquinone oxidoreductase subunit H